MAQFTIKRSKWLRGEGGLESRLLRPEDGKQCCIGQIGSQLGVPDECLSDIRSIYGLGPVLAKPFIDAGLARIHFDSAVRVDWVSQAYAVNDDMDTKDDEREKKLIALAAENGHTLTFID